MTETRIINAGDSAILKALKGGPFSTREVADRVRRAAWEAWSERHGYDFEWDTDEEPVGARILASGEARKRGLKLHAYEIHPRLRALEKRGLVERVQLAGHRPMLWRRSLGFPVPGPEGAPE
jgi:hypothetical protein